MLTKHPKPQIGTEERALTRRIVALFLDGTILMVIVGILFFIGIEGLWIFELSEEEFFLFILLPLGVMEVFYFSFFEGFMGQTIGKKIMKIVVVKEDGSPCAYKSSFIRNFFRIIDAMGIGPVRYLLGGIVALFLTKKKQRIGDLIAKTIVVKVDQENE